MKLKTNLIFIFALGLFLLTGFRSDKIGGAYITRIFFQPNSVEYLKAYPFNSVVKSDSALKKAFSVLTVDKQGIKIIGYACFDEKDPDAISLKRAQTIKQILTSWGADAHKIKTESFGAKNSLQSKKLIDQTKDKSKRDSLRTLTRYVEIHFLPI
jgi:outer membrane protein OmpA-like peptidoglycan-associated protein